MASQIAAEYQGLDLLFELRDSSPAKDFHLVIRVVIIKHEFFRGDEEIIE